MYKRSLVFGIACFCFFAYLEGVPLELKVDPNILLGDAERVGINLGTWTTWGAEQFSKNILMNPGFEGYVDRIVVITSQADKTSFSDELEWGYDDNYWNGATFEVRSGSANGTRGKITHSLRKGAKSFPQYFTEKPLPALEAKDVITLTKFGDEDPIPIWWIDDNSKTRVHAEANEKRPLSTGIQSLALEPKPDAPAIINYYLDAITDRAGKLLPVNGKWRFSIWMKSDTADNAVQIFFRRINGSKPFFEKTFSLTTEWVEYTIDFDAHDEGEPQSLQLQIAAAGSGGKVWLDDVFLGPMQQENNTNFRQEIIAVLQKINPSYIRDTQGQLGDTFANRIADSYGRRTVSSRAYAGTRSLSTAYSIPDLLQLCKIVKANPWIVVPPTFSDEEAFLLGEFLALHASKEVFSSVIVEFGNENWNWVFRSTSIPYPLQHGLVADKIFKQIKKGANGKVSLQTVVNGQHASPEMAGSFAQSTPSAETIAIAPYFFYSLNANETMDKNLKDLFADDGGQMRKLAKIVEPMGKKLAVYEVNVHTDKGSAKQSERNSYVAGQAAGSALAKRLIEGMLLKIQPEIVFSLAQFDVDAPNQEKTRLWGVVRDLGVTDRLRPQGLAMVMLNSVIGGEMHAVSSGENGITAVAFKYGAGWKAAAVNATGETLDVSIEFAEGSLPTNLSTLHAQSPLDTNEDNEKVTVKSSALQSAERRVEFSIPAWGLVVLNHEEITF